MTEVKHTPYQYETCGCRDCKGSRDSRDLQKLREEKAKRIYGDNWKNIMSGMGDQ